MAVKLLVDSALSTKFLSTKPLSVSRETKQEFTLSGSGTGVFRGQTFPKRAGILMFSPSINGFILIKVPELQEFKDLDFAGLVFED